jgi:hypothetical protein
VTLRQALDATQAGMRRSEVEVELTHAVQRQRQIGPALATLGAVALALSIINESSLVLH